MYHRVLPFGGTPILVNFRIKMKNQKALVLLALFGPSVDAGCATQEWLAAGRPLQVQYVFDVHMYTTPLLLCMWLIINPHLEHLFN